MSLDPIRVGNNCCCDGGSSGSGSGDGVVYYDVTCLSSVCGGVGAQYSCPSARLPNNWCINDLGNAAVGSECPGLFNYTNLNIVGDVCTGVCSWQRISSSGSPQLSCDLALRSFQVDITLVCSGADPNSIGTGTPDNGVLLRASITAPGPTLYVAYYFIAADDFDCDGPNVLILIADNGPAEDWAASITITPCGPDPAYPSAFCE
jgi:hypothetical protein